MSVIFHINHLLMWLDDSIAAMRTFDVLRSLDMVEFYGDIDVEDIEIYAHGRQGLYGRLAAVLDECIKNVKVVEEMQSYKNWICSRHYDHKDISSVIFPNALRYSDLPDIDRWIAEMR